MIQQLRKKFIVINMSLIAGVLILVFLAIVAAIARQTERTIDEALRMTLNIRLEDAPSAPEIGKRRSGDARKSEQSAAILPSFCVQLDQSGQVVDFMQQNATVSDSVMRDAAAQAAATGKRAGLLKEYELRYSIRYSSAGLKIAFIDVGAERAKMLRFALTLLTVGIAGLAAFFLVSLFLSAWALRPVEQAWERQRQFATDASCALKAPVEAVLDNTAALLAHPQETADAQRKRLACAQKEARRMHMLIEDMQYLAQFDAAAPVPMERFSLSGMVNDAVGALAAQADEAGVRLNTDITGDVEWFGNQRQIDRLVAILLDLAIRSAGASGVVSVRLAAFGTGAAIAVTHTVKSIAVNRPERRLEHFACAGTAYDRAADGYEFELAVAQSIAQTHRAEIGITRDPVDGVTYTVLWKERMHDAQD